MYKKEIKIVSAIKRCQVVPDSLDVKCDMINICKNLNATRIGLDLNIILNIVYLLCIALAK